MDYSNGPMFIFQEAQCKFSNDDNGELINIQMSKERCITEEHHST